MIWFIINGFFFVCRMKWSIVMVYGNIFDYIKVFEGIEFKFLKVDRRIIGEYFDYIVLYIEYWILYWFILINIYWVFVWI